MTDNENVDLGFAVEIVHGDVFEFQADVLVIKYAYDSFGTEAEIVRRIEQSESAEKLPQPRGVAYRLWYSGDATQTEQVLILGLRGSILDLTYARVRTLGRLMLKALWENRVEVRHLVSLVHGVGLGLDETEALRSLLLGMSDACAKRQYPPMLERVTFVNRDKLRVEVFQRALEQFLSTTGEASALESGQVPRLAGPESFEPEFRKPEADETTPHIFVAMPFKDDFDDQFYLAIQPCVKELGLLCERMDLDTFTGDIVDHMLERIQTARLVIALLDDGNPNVFLEVGYAWGVGTQTVLMAHKEQPLPFDVRGHRVLIYDKIYQLKNMLQEELQRLFT